MFPTCYPISNLDNTWKERLCKECSKDLGHCPMRFFEGSASREQVQSARKQICLCHREYNHCIANNDYGYILEIEPKTDITALDIDEFSSRVATSRTTTSTTTQAPELKQALGFEVGLFLFF